MVVTAFEKMLHLRWQNYGALTNVKRRFGDGEIYCVLCIIENGYKYFKIVTTVKIIFIFNYIKLFELFSLNCKFYIKYF